MIRARLLTPLAVAALFGAALTGVAAPAGAAAARPATSCKTLEERMVADYDKYEQDVHQYGKNDPRTKKAYDTYVQAKYAYMKCL